MKCNQPGYKRTYIVVHSGSEGYGGYAVSFLVGEHVHGSVYKRFGKLFGSGIGWAVRENPAVITLI